MRWVKPVTWGQGRDVQTGTCRKCDMTVHLYTHPAPNGVEIGGEAVALNCKGAA